MATMKMFMAREMLYCKFREKEDNTNYCILKLQN